MPVQQIRLYPDPILKTVCEPVGEFSAETDRIIQDLIDTMVDAGHSVGVAAPQIGMTTRIAVVDVSKSKLGRDENHGLLVLVNPVILQSEGSKVMREGCMSLPDFTGNVVRAQSILVQFLGRGGEDRVIRAHGFEAVAIQHEMDHLDGCLFLDRISSLKTDLFRRKR